ncbi:MULTISPECIES: hypothetical protein [Kitasatospora]|uniref:Uncharacterized protein n=1 Tax=Kitasatospora setae (strain ATCC 33774 / DSM 43861 / JCM 3304 / KCC A-0304 / NBRC 14216 / KM-6054) TaxID=452652 RepID=E4NFV5_KITSK|nr:MULTISPECIES: hypothetical protein [Kitasatospora]BAJ30385.1 hypothetical protein KSE_46040 [Kitasatospora setae KM-6054]
MSTWHPPAPPGLDTGPRRRSGLTLALQFCLQWLWIPIRLVPLDFEDPSTEPLSHKIVLTPRRYRLERRGTREEWETWTGEALDRAIARAREEVAKRQARNDSGTYPCAFAGPSLVPETTLRRHYYRGTGLDGLAALAARRGWRVRWETARFEEVGLIEVRPQQPPYPQPQSYSGQAQLPYAQPQSYQQQAQPPYPQPPDPRQANPYRR